MSSGDVKQNELADIELKLASARQAVATPGGSVARRKPIREPSSGTDEKLPSGTKQKVDKKLDEALEASFRAAIRFPLRNPLL